MPEKKDGRKPGKKGSEDFLGWKTSRQKITIAKGCLGHLNCGGGEKKKRGGA